MLNFISNYPFDGSSLYDYDSSLAYNVGYDCYLLDNFAAYDEAKKWAAGGDVSAQEFIDGWVQAASDE